MYFHVKLRNQDFFHNKLFSRDLDAAPPNQTIFYFTHRHKFITPCTHTNSGPNLKQFFFYQFQNPNVPKMWILVPQILSKMSFWNGLFTYESLYMQLNLPHFSIEVPYLMVWDGTWFSMDPDMPPRWVCVCVYVVCTRVVVVIVLYYVMRHQERRMGCKP